MAALMGAALAVLVAASAVMSALAEPVRIGVLAKRGGEVAEARWAPTPAYLTEAIPGRRFEVVPLDFDGIFRAAKDREVAYILANPAIYVEMEARLNASRLATLRNRAGDHALTRFGGILFTRAARTDIRTPGDLRGCSLMAVDRHSLGG